VEVIGVLLSPSDQRFRRVVGRPEIRTRVKIPGDVQPPGLRRSGNLSAGFDPLRRGCCIEKMGSNGWRTADNTVASEMLDGCDQPGMLVMVEARIMSSSPGSVERTGTLNNHLDITMYPPEEGPIQGARAREGNQGYLGVFNSRTKPPSVSIHSKRTPIPS